MRIFILGANGMLARALINELSDEDLFLGDLPDFDLTKFDDLEEKISALKPEVIINAAAYTNVDGCETDQNVCLEVNGEAVGNLAKIAKKLGSILVHFSTDYVFDGKNKEGYKEDGAVAPLNMYGQSKALGEKLLQKNCEQYYLIRSAWLYGLNGKNFVDTIIDLSTKQQVIKVVNDQVGSPTYAKDLAQAVHQLIVDKKPFGIYHRTNDGKCSWYDFALAVKKIKNFSAEIEAITTQEMPRPATRPSNSVLINTKLPALRSWQDALTEYLNLQ